MMNPLSKPLQPNSPCRRVAALCLLSSACSLLAQAPAASTRESVLQRRYDAAQKFQAAHDFDHAAQQYQIFIADALGELAFGRARAGEYNRAANNFDAALALVPDFPAMQMEYAHVALDDGDYDRAKLLATGVIRSYPNNPKLQADAHAILGRVLLKTNDDQGAKQQFEAAVALDPTFPNGYELAVADLDLGDGPGARKIFTEMLSSFGDTAAIHMYFGQAYGRSDFQDDAVAEFKKAIAKDDKLPGVHYSLAAAYLATAGNSKLDEAEQELRKEIAISPNSAVAYAALGHLLAQQHHDPATQLEAENDLKHAVALAPDDPDGYFYLGQFYADAKQTPEAEAALRQSIALTKDVSRNSFQVQKAHYLLGRLLMQSGSVDEGKQQIAISQSLLRQNLQSARSQLSDYLQTSTTSRDTNTEAPPMPVAVEDRAIDPAASHQTDELEKQLAPAIADSYNNLGAIAGSKSNYPVALHYFDQAAEWNPTLPGLDLNWGRAAFAAGAFEQAVGPLSHYLQAHPEDDAIRAQLGLSQFSIGNYAATVKTLRPLDAKGSEAPPLQYAYAESLVQSGDTQAGIAKLVDLEKASPQVAEVHRALGEAYAAEKSSAATQEFETAIRLNPADAEAHIALAHLQWAKGETKAAAANLEAAAKLEPQNAALQKELADVTHQASPK
ncbi:MAG: tetratricopeptide repeat protein [Acidobacteriaceae bacterium]